MAQTADVVICGAGIAGIAAAYYLATQQNVTDILLVDRRAPLTLTSDKSGECYRNWWVNPSMVRLMNRSIDLMETLADETNNAFRMNRRGYAYISSAPDTAEKTQRQIDHYRPLPVGEIRVHQSADSSYAPSADDDYRHKPDGADILLDPTLIQQHYPCLADSVKSIIHARRAGWFSAQQLGMVMLEKARALGIREIRGEVTAIQHSDKGVEAVEIATAGGHEHIQTRTFINAAGPFQGQVAQLLGVQLPVHNVLHQKVVFQDHQSVIPRAAPFLIYLDAQELDWSDEEREWLKDSPEDRWLLNQFPGGLHVRPEGGANSNWIKVGWAYNHQPAEPTETPRLPDEFPDVVVRGAARYIPGMKAYIDNIPQPFMYDGGFYTKTRENLPIIGAMGVPGAYVIGALSGFGLMAACGAGELIGQWICNTTLPDYAQHLSLGRYNDAAYVALLDKVGASGEL